MATKKTPQQFLIELQERNLRYPSRPLTLTPDQTYQGTYIKLYFQCHNNHVVLMSPKNVLSGYDCNQCAMSIVGINNKKTHENFIIQLEQRNILYPDKQVTLVDGIYKNTNTPLLFSCNKGHSWYAIPKTIIRGSYCPTCKISTTVNAHKYTTEIFKDKLQEHLIQNPEKSVSLLPNQQYTGFRDKLKFSCNQQHEWYTTPDNILNGNSGCPTCAKTKTFSLKALAWLRYIEQEQGVIIQHANNYGEYTIPGTRFKADGYCIETNTIYEFYGDFWHGNPLTTNHAHFNDITQTTFGELYEKTMEREEVIKQLGYNIVSIWESTYDTAKKANDFYHIVNKLKITTHNIYYWTLSDLYQTADNNTKFTLLNLTKSSTLPSIHIYEDEWNSNKPLVISKLTHYSQQSNTTRIHARQCCIREIDKKQKQQFLNTFHIQGADNSQLYYGAFLNNELLAVMTFTSPRVALGYKNKDRSLYEGVWELSRFATNTAYRIPGIASKLLKHFEHNNTWTEIYSYADKRWSTGNMYIQLNFTLVADNPPDYFYVINGARKHRWNYRKDILKHKLANYNPLLTEYQNMVNHGYYRVWDCGTLKFTKINNIVTP
jgi:hypothetical protein